MNMSTAYPEATVIGTQVRELRSAINGQIYQLAVMLPRTYAESQRSYPVLYLLDGNLNIGKEGIQATFLGYAKETPELIIVGIGYNIHTLAEWSAHRNRDMTPTATDDTPGSGGADKFLACVETELIPFIESEYRADPSDRTIYGYSFGGLFVLYSMLRRPGLFRRIIAGSPSVGYDHRAMFSYESEYASHNTSLPARLFLSAGSLEHGPRSGEIQPNTQAFYDVLASRNYAGLEMTLAIHEGQTHATNSARTFAKGLKAVFA
jgi:uncharacterized protein